MADTGSPFFIPYIEDTDLVRDYPAADEAQADAIAGQFGKGFQFAGQRIYTSSGTFVKADPLGTGDIGLRAIKVRMVGGGGSGAGASSTSSSQFAFGSGGGGGGSGESFISDIAGLSATETVTRGSGASAVTGFTAGNAGGASSFSGISVGGGQGGSPSRTNLAVMQLGGAGGTSTSSDVSTPGSAGREGFATAVNNFRQYGGGGGDTTFCGGARGVQSGSSGTNGNNGVSFGAGGSGAANPPSDGTNRTSGAGANGVVIIDCFV